MTELQEKYAKRVVVFDDKDNIISLTEWQKQYDLKDIMIGRYYSFMEPKFMQDIQDYGKLMVSVPLIVLLDKYRSLKARSNKINSFNRSKEKQRQLHEAGYKTAQHSPHEEYLAADCDTDNDTETLQCVELVRKAADLLKYQVRIGFKQYMEVKQTFIHVDVCPMYFGVGKVRHEEKHHILWEQENTW